MDFGNPAFILAIIAVSYGVWLINNWIRAKHGYPLEDEWGGKSERIDTGENARLREENSQLRDQLGLVNDRVAVLERIVTDKGYGLAEQIEALRDASDTGVPINPNRQERA